MKSRRSCWVFQLATVRSADGLAAAGSLLAGLAQLVLGVLHSIEQTTRAPCIWGRTCGGVRVGVEEA